MNRIGLVYALGITTLLYAIAVTQLQAESRSLDPVCAWNKAFLEAVQLSSTAPGLASRNSAILHAAMHDGIAAIRGRDTFLLVDTQAPGPVDEGAFAEIIGARMLELFYPSLRGKTRAMLDERTREYDPEVLDAASSYALVVIKAALDSRKADGAANTLTYVPKDELGKWRRTPPNYRPPELSHWYNVDPFVLPSAGYFRPPPPPALDSPEYAESVNEVMRLGGTNEATSRTGEQTLIANFWSCFSYTSTPAGHWHHILSDIIDRRGIDDLLFIARAHALLGIALADAGVAAWDCKYYYEFWRPVQAIHSADLDGNPLTAKDPDWESLLEAPPHPEYVSGHSTFSGAGAQMLQNIFGTDSIRFTATSSSYPDAPREYTSLQACAEECGMSRIHGGIHFGFSNREGLKLGRRVADYVFNHSM